MTRSLATGLIALAMGFLGPVCGNAEEASAIEKARIAELDAYWVVVSKAVKEGDFESYRSTCHPEAVYVNGIRKQSYPLAKALARWKKEFDDTKAGIRKSSVDFRFSQRVGDATTAHETGMFLYATVDKHQALSAVLHLRQGIAKR